MVGALLAIPATLRKVWRWCIVIMLYQWLPLCRVMGTTKNPRYHDWLCVPRIIFYLYIMGNSFWDSIQKPFFILYMVNLHILNKITLLQWSTFCDIIITNLTAFNLWRQLMSNISFSVSIPLDEDGFLEMQCDYCKGRFMLSKETFESEDNLNFFCPICGLPNKINEFYCPEVIEKAKQVAINYEYDEIYKQLSQSFRGINKSKYIRANMNKPKHIHENELYKPTYEYIKTKLSCCDIVIKVTTLDDEIGVYCPICGGTTL